VETLAVDMLNLVVLADIGSVLSSVWNILLVALGLGLVIFFHELGHFAVAKWCDVHVERFSIGFGPILWSRQRGETEYALSAIPFGGYVKMLGQDDMDASQMADENIAQNPRSYSAKKVWQRMAIISAGVIMNIITAFLFFSTAFLLGVMDAPPIIGGMVAGSPAWEHGLKQGDKITHINGEKMSTFSDISMTTALSTGDLVVKGVGVDGKPFEKTITPDASGSTRSIGIENTVGLEVATPIEEGRPVAFPGLPAAACDPPLEPGDTIISLDGIKLTDYAHMKRLMQERLDKTIEFELQRRAGDDGKPGPNVKTKVEAAEFRSFGFAMAIGPIAGIQLGSPAASCDPPLKVGDVIQSVNGRSLGDDLDPMQLNVYLASLSGQDKEVEIKVKRQVEGKADGEVTVNLKPKNIPWGTMPIRTNKPMAAPAIGVAYFVSTHVAKVRAGSEAEMAGIEKGDKIVKIELIRQSDQKDVFKEPNEAVELEPKDDEKTDPVNWAVAYIQSQKVPQRKVTFHIKRGDKTFAKSVEQFEAEQGFYLPFRGFQTMTELQERKATGFGEALAMGIDSTWKNVLQIYLTLRSLATGRISAKELHGPIGIAKVGYRVASQGVSQLLLFLGFLSVNLAVLNFLPIPVLDGGHMVFLTYEAVAGKKPSEKVLIAAQYVGLILILGLMIFVVGQDFMRLAS